MRPTVEHAAVRLATLLQTGGTGLSAPTRSDLVFVEDVVVEPLAPAGPPPALAAVDGGQVLVADARCFQVYATRASLVRWAGTTAIAEDEGDLRVHLLGAGGEAEALAAQGAPVAGDAAVDVNLLREWGEWERVAAAVGTADAGDLVLVDGDLQPDWRLPPAWMAGLLEEAADRSVRLVGVTKHSSLTRGGAPLLGWLEREAARRVGERTPWWARVASSQPEVGPGLDIVVARLDPDARFAFRIDLAGGTPIEETLGRLAAVADDAAFPGYPYPLTVADRLAACGPWVRAELWDRLESEFERLGVPGEVRDRAFADRHRLMERS